MLTIYLSLHQIEALEQFETVVSIAQQQKQQKVSGDGAEVQMEVTTDMLAHAHLGSAR